MRGCSVPTAPAAPGGWSRGRRGAGRVGAVEVAPGRQRWPRGHDGIGAAASRHADARAPGSSSPGGAFRYAALSGRSEHRRGVLSVEAPFLPAPSRRPGRPRGFSGMSRLRKALERRQAGWASIRSRLPPHDLLRGARNGPINERRFAVVRYVMRTNKPLSEEVPTSSKKTAVNGASEAGPTWRRGSRS